MARRPPRRIGLLEAAVVFFACLASGSLECGGAPVSVAERRGTAVYRRMCAVCHGLEGEGYKADEATALGNRAFLASVSEPFLRRAIIGGRAGTTMSAWGREKGGPLTRTEVDDIEALLHGWATGPRAVLDERPMGGDAARGADVFGRECARCHGERGTGGPYVNIGGGEFLTTASDGYLRLAIREGRPGTPMQGYASALGDRGVEDVLAFVRGLEVKAAASPAPKVAARPPPLPLGPVPLNPRGPEPVGFKESPGTTPADLVKQQLDRGAKMALLDARAPTDYAAEHITGAVSVPFYDPDPYVGALPRDAWLVCYCACPHAESGQLARSLKGKGFAKVTVLDEGLGVWRARKYGTTQGWDP